MKMTTIEELKLCAENWHSKHPTRTLILSSISELEALMKENCKLRSTVEYVASLQNLFFAECSQAEEIVERCRKALEANNDDNKVS